MRTIRSHTPHSSAEANAPAPRLTFSGALLLVSGFSTSLMVAATGFTVAMTMVWPN
jgi:hypothetical protein